MDLAQYDQMKFRLAEILRAGMMHVRQMGGDPEMARDVYARLAEDRFNLVVVGRFSRGKTSLMNAMLGSDRLPTGIVPVTSVITTVAYGTDEKVVLYYYNSHLFMDIRLNQLAQYITERGNPGNMRGIRTAEVQLPAEILRRGFHFIDTPGLGSSIVENTRTTEAFLPEADAFVLVTSYDSPLSEEEQRVLRTIHDSGRRVFMVVNKQDCVGSVERQQVIEHLRRQLPGIFGAAVPPLFSISAQQGLAARLAGDPDRLRDSGLPSLEAALIEFLVNEKRTEFLLSMCVRIGAILDSVPGAGGELNRLSTLRSEIEAARAVRVPAQVHAEVSAIAADLPPCEVCTRVTEAVFDFLCEYQSKLHGEERAQADLARRHGLCGPHTWQFEAVAATREVCTGFAQVLQRYAADLRTSSSGQEGPMPWARQAIGLALPNVETCPVCDVARRSEAAAVGDIAQRLARDPANTLRNLSAICIPHLVPLLSALGNSPLARKMMVRQAEVLERLSEDMRRFALKRDAVRRYLSSKEEETAAKRALHILAGHPNAQLGPVSRLPENITPLPIRTGAPAPRADALGMPWRKDET